MPLIPIYLQGAAAASSSVVRGAPLPREVGLFASPEPAAVYDQENEDQFRQQVEQSLREIVAYADDLAGLRLPTNVTSDQYGVTTADQAVRYNGAVAGTITLPKITDTIRGLTVPIMNQTTNTLTVEVESGSGDTINGASTKVISTQYEAFWFIAPETGSDWLAF